MLKIGRLAKLKNRVCLSLAGDLAKVRHLLQAITTNDVHRLTDEGSQFTLMLNARGRLVADCLLYEVEDGICLDCERSQSEVIAKHISAYDIRKQIKVKPSERSVWALFSESGEPASPAVDGEVAVRKDPRLGLLGYRILTNSVLEGETLTKLLKIDCEINESFEYERHRYRLGVGEGPRELSSGSGFPLECNGDYLRGISFDKGCYVGQELTARTYHSGVTRKRIMPLEFEKTPGDIPIDAPIRSEADPETSVGKFRGVSGNVGIALLRIAPALSAPSLTVDGHRMKTFKPSWWPIEEPK